MIGGETLRGLMPEELPSNRVAQAVGKTAAHKFFLLFIFLLGYLIFYPYTQNSVAGYISFRVLAIAITLLSLYAVSFQRSLVLVGLALAIPKMIEHLHILKADSGSLWITNLCLTLAFDAFIIVIIFRRVFVQARPNSETIFGALCIYLMLGFSFANIYGLVATLQRQAFYLDRATNLHAVPNQFDFIYYSFGTMTSLGAAGIAAVSDQARSLSVVEAMLGLLYLAVLISRLMSAYRSDR